MQEFKILDGTAIDDEDLMNRRAHIDAIVVHHKRYNNLLKELRDCHVLQKKSINKKGMCIFGETGAGKSTLFKDYEANHPRRDVDCTTVVPVLRAELDSNSTPRNVASKLLEKLGDPYYYKGTEKELTSRLKGLLSITQVELIIIDEFQHLIDTEKDKVIRKAADWVKQFANEINITIILGGILDSTKIFKNNQQLDERFQQKEKFLSFKYKSEEEKREFRGFLKSIYSQLPFPSLTEQKTDIPKPPKLFDPYLAEKIYYASLGVPRSINHLIVQSATIALRHGRDLLEEKHLHDGFDKLVLVNRPNVINPFNGKKFDLKLALEIEKGKK
jgi:hypothetical protein